MVLWCFTISCVRDLKAILWLFTFLSIRLTADFFHSFPPQFMGIINRYSNSIFRSSGSKSEFFGILSVYLFYCGRRKGKQNGQTADEEIIINLVQVSLACFQGTRVELIGEMTLLTWIGRIFEIQMRFHGQHRMDKFHLLFIGESREREICIWPFHPHPRTLLSLANQI